MQYDKQVNQTKAQVKVKTLKIVIIKEERQEMWSE